LGRLEAERAEVEEEEEEEEGDYRVADMHDQYKSMAVIGRLAPGYSLLALKQMMDGEGGCLTRLQRLYSTGGGGVSSAEVSRVGGVIGVAGEGKRGGSGDDHILLGKGM